MQIFVHFNADELGRWMRATHRLETKARQEWEDHPRRCSLRYVMLLRRNIATQKHMGGYADYNPRYAEWKEQFGRLRGFWRLFGDLMNNLTHWRTLVVTPNAKAWIGGIPGHVVDSGGKSWFTNEKKSYGRPKPIAMYGRVMEFGGTLPRGGGTHPPRPVFDPTRVEFRDGEFLDLGRRSLWNIARGWR